MQTDDDIETSSRRRFDVLYNDVIIASCARWDMIPEEVSSMLTHIHGAMVLLDSVMKSITLTAIPRKL